MGLYDTYVLNLFILHLRCSIHVLFSSFFSVNPCFCPRLSSPPPLHVEKNGARRYSEEQRLMATGLTAKSTSDNRRAGGLRGSRGTRWVKTTEGKQNAAWDMRIRWDIAAFSSALPCHRAQLWNPHLRAVAQNVYLRVFSDSPLTSKPVSQKCDIKLGSRKRVSSEGSFFEFN